MAKAAVWGANGYIGSRVVRGLILDGWEVRAVVRDSKSLMGNDVKQAHEVRFLKLEDEASAFYTAFSDVDVIINCVGEPTNNNYVNRIYLEAIKKLADILGSLGTNKLIHVSTVAVYGDVKNKIVTTNSPLQGKTDYAICRKEAERLILAADTADKKVHIVRIPMVIGEGMHSQLFYKIRSRVFLGLFFHPGSEDSTLNCISVNKLVRALLFIAKSQDSYTNIWQFSDAVKWIDILDTVSKISGISIRRVYFPTFIFKALAFITLSQKIQNVLYILDNKVLYESTLIDNSSFKDDLLLDLELAIHSSLKRLK